jgi:hypothetical protein
MLMAEGLITSPAFIVLKAADRFANPTTAINSLRKSPPPMCDRSALRLTGGTDNGTLLSDQGPAGPYQKSLKWPLH